MYWYKTFREKPYHCKFCTKRFSRQENLKNHRRKTHQAEIKKEEIAERSKSQQKSLASKRSKMSPKKPRVSPLNIMSPTKLNYSPTKQNQNNITESSKFLNGPRPTGTVLNGILVHCQACEHLNPNCPNCVTLYHQKYWEWAMLLHHQRLLHARNPQHGPHQMIPTVPEHHQARGKNYI